MIIKKLQELKAQAEKELQDLRDSGALEDAKTKYLGRKGELANVMKALKDLAKEEKPKVGQAANEVKKEVTELFNKAEKVIKNRGKANVDLDPSLPGTRRQIGHLHPSTQVQNEIEDAFLRMGFTNFDGPQLDSEYYNFTALNIPEDHPARDSQDTFWVEGNNVLRTHMSNMQVRLLEKLGAPMRAIYRGRCFRNEATDASHEHTFYQIEGMMVDKDINVGHLVATLKAMLSSVFKTDVDVRIRPGFFPFTEPSYELDMKCLVCGGEGCSVCKQSGWVEMLGCGLVHPQVLRNGGIDPDEYSGWAFGAGLTRIVMMKYKINDIRLLESGDLRFLRQF